jgi:hypothetical protein
MDKTWSKVKDKITGTPQLTTAGGIGGLVYQLSQTLATVKVGGFLAHISTLTYGALISSYSPIVLFIIMIMFNETDFLDKFKKDLNEKK